jgi:hypothetical protein
VNYRAASLLLVIVAFAALTVVALRDHGYVGLIAFHFTATAGMQVIADLVIVCTLAIFWMLRDAARCGRNPWPYVVATLFLGSFGPLFYLLVGELSAERKQVLA